MLSFQFKLGLHHTICMCVCMYVCRLHLLRTNISCKWDGNSFICTNFRCRIYIETDFQCRRLLSYHSLYDQSYRVMTDYSYSSHDIIDVHVDMILSLFIIENNFNNKGLRESRSDNNFELCS